MNSTIHKVYFATILVAYPLDQEFTYSFKADQMINEMSERRKRGEDTISIPSRKQVMKH